MTLQSFLGNSVKNRGTKEDFTGVVTTNWSAVQHHAPTAKQKKYNNRRSGKEEEENLISPDTCRLGLHFEQNERPRETHKITETTRKTKTKQNKKKTEGGTVTIA